MFANPRPFLLLVDKNLKEGDVLDAVITKLMPYGAFAELIKGVEGMIHVSELSWTRVEKPEEAVQPGDKVKVKPGYGRNFLIPYGKAVPATADNVAAFEAKRAEYEAKAKAVHDEAEGRADQLVSQWVPHICPLAGGPLR